MMRHGLSAIRERRCVQALSRPVRVSEKEPRPPLSALCDKTDAALRSLQPPRFYGRWWGRYSEQLRIPLRPLPQGNTQLRSFLKRDQGSSHGLVAVTVHHQHSIRSMPAEPLDANLVDLVSYEARKGFSDPGSGGKED